MSSYDSYRRMYALGVLTADEVRRLFGVPKSLVSSPDPYLFSWDTEWESLADPFEVVVHRD